ncbi:hypothetical protein [Pseudobacteroides cellulosolvens]|uniref:Uncharacterized protein n=1 Tax=Pseudobacteroides cellulosolvens ATCC 35603 = DSM 2933 TaxID=398512 RepID=A0A0L6JWZ2_9FIRM|nr:hypothetical protein [Pseudobacteroides cellulosolvens]KNY30371.1 hypothetical protein Bccel_5651 [Pseudobacteroides cellulosolvens ATCC 35603 = DSM 2933]
MEPKDDNLNNESNEFEKNLSDLKEWQDNQYNPGYYVGTGKVATPIKNMVKHPVLLLILGLFVGLINGIPLLTRISTSDFSADLLLNIIILVISILLIYRSIVALAKNKTTEEK